MGVVEEEVSGPTGLEGALFGSLLGECKLLKGADEKAYP